MSLFLPVVPTHTRHVPPFAKLVASTPLYRLWAGHSVGLDSIQAFTFAAGAGQNFPTGVAVHLMPLQHPYTLALQSASLARITGHPTVCGIGPGTVSLQRSMMGKAFSSPISATFEYVSCFSQLIETGTARFEGEYYSCARDMPFPVAAAGVEIGIGVLRPKMALVAGQLSDVAITWLSPARYIENVLRPALAEGAVMSRRAQPRVAAVVPFALRHSDSADGWVYAAASSSSHIKALHYRRMLGLAGIPVSGSDNQADGRALISGQSFLFGALEEVVALARRFFEAGVDEVILNPTGIYLVDGPRQAVKQVRDLSRALCLNV